MINPTDLLAALQQAHNIASGLYRAGAGMPKYRLYLELFKAAPGNPPFTPHREDFINFLVQAKILLKDEDYQQFIVNNVEHIYRARYAKDAITEVTGKVTGAVSTNKEKVENNEFPFLLAEVDRRYQEFSEAYEKVATKGYSTAAATVSRQVVKKEDKPAPAKAKQEVASVSLDIFRKNFVELVAPEKVKEKKKEEEETEDKEINIEKAAKTNALDVQPIPVRINQQTVFLAPRKVQRNMHLKENVEARSAAAAKAARVAAEPMTADNLSKINSGIAQYLLKRETHKDNRFIKNSLKRVPPFSSPALVKPMFRGLPAESSTHILAIIAIVSENKHSDPKIEKGMSISRISSVGHVNRCYVNPPAKPQPSSFEAMSSMESIEIVIKEKLGDTPEAKQLIATLKKLKEENPQLKIGDIFDQYMQDVMFPAEVNGKKPIESVVELCEADATALEYVASMREILEKSKAYLETEASLNSNSIECIKLSANLSMVSGKATVDTASLIPQQAETAKDRSDTESVVAESEESVEQTETPLKRFSQSLQQRVESKNKESLLKTVKRTVKLRKDNAKQKQERTEDALSEASLMIEENLEFVLKQGKNAHKTKEREIEHQANIQILDAKRQALQEKRENLDAQHNEVQIRILMHKSLFDKAAKEKKHLSTDAQNETERLKAEIAYYNEFVLELEKKIDQLEDSIKDLEDKIDDYLDDELLENPEVIVESICRSMHAARQTNTDGSINETANETATQSKIFQEFCDALCATPSEGRALAIYVRDHVVKSLNQGVTPQNQIVVNVIASPAAALAKPMTPVTSPIASPVSASAPSLLYSPQDKTRMTPEQYKTYVPDANLVAQRKELVADLEKLLQKKQDENEKYKANNEGKDNPKIAQLKNALHYLTCGHEFDVKKDTSVEQAYATAVIQTDKPIESKFSLHKKFDKAMSGNMLKDRTPLLLEAVDKHVAEVKAKHEEYVQNVGKTVQPGKNK